MARFDVFGVSDWPEDAGKRFAIYENTEFVDAPAAIAAARAEYNDKLEVVVVPHDAGAVGSRSALR